MRCTTMVRKGSLAAASAKASLARISVTPSISKRTLPGWISATKYSGLPLPLPMRTSAGLVEIGLSGKTRIQMRPPRLMWRDMARRAASSWRAVNRPRVTAFRPYSPNDTLAPRVATPVLRPFCCFLYLVLAGCSIQLLLGFPARVVLDDLLRFLDRGFRRRGVRLARSFLAVGARLGRRAACACSGRGFLRALGLRGLLGLRDRRGGRREPGLHLALGHHFAFVHPDL